MGVRSEKHTPDFIADSYASPTATALAFLSTLVETRAKTSLLPLLQFIQSVVDKWVSHHSHYYAIEGEEKPEAYRIAELQVPCPDDSETKGRCAAHARSFVQHGSQERTRLSLSLALLSKLIKRQRRLIDPD